MWLMDNITNSLINAFVIDSGNYSNQSNFRTYFDAAFNQLILATQQSRAMVMEIALTMDLANVAKVMTDKDAIDALMDTIPIQDVLVETCWNFRVDLRYFFLAVDVLTPLGDCSGKCFNPNMQTYRTPPTIA
jgi:hypothetical protein